MYDKVPVKQSNWDFVVFVYISIYNLNLVYMYIIVYTIFYHFIPCFVWAGSLFKTFGTQWHTKRQIKLEEMFDKGVTSHAWKLVWKVMSLL
jgi:hypothetical protein